MRDLRIVEADSDLRGLVRELATDGAATDGDGGEQLLSMYVNLDPREFALASARSSGITSALDEAERSAPDGTWAPLLRELRETFAAADYSIDGASGLLVFARGGGDVTVVKLPTPVEAEVAFDSQVHIRQLVEALPSERWCVLLCNRRATRIFVGDRHRLAEVDAFVDEVDGQHDQGGYSQKRWARNIQEQVDDHLRHASRAVVEHCRSGEFDFLLVACPQELRGELEGFLHEDCRRTLRGWLDLDVEHATPVQVLAAARPEIARRDNDRVVETLGRLQQNAGRGERAALGLDDVVAALREQRVETLVVNAGYTQPGLTCPHGDWFDSEPGTCPVHDLRLQPCADIVEVAIEAAVRQNARIMTLERSSPEGPLADDGTRQDRPEFLNMQALGSIAAIVRFDLDEGARSTGANAGVGVTS